MPKRLGLFVSVAFGLVATPLAAGPVPKEVLDPDQFAATLRPLALAKLPVPLVKSEADWGHQREVANAIRWERKGQIRRRPVVVKKLKNDGIWQRATVTIINPEHNLALAVGDIRVPENGKMTFQVFIRCPCQIDYDRQNWKAGVRVYSGSARARCWAAIRVHCEAHSQLRMEAGLPELTFRLKVTEADLHYEKLHVEHVFGIGGDGAKIIGERIETFIDRRKPEFRERLLSKANAAIVKAGDTKDIHLRLSSLIGGD